MLTNKDENLSSRDKFLSLFVNWSSELVPGQVLPHGGRVHEDEFSEGPVPYNSWGVGLGWVSCVNHICFRVMTHLRTLNCRVTSSL